MAMAKPTGARLLVKKSVIRACLAAAKSALPNEFIGILSGKKEKGEDGFITITIDNMVVPNGIRVTESQSFFDDWLSPINMDSIGSFHSHPSPGLPRPSRQDVAAFSKEGGIHLIASMPFVVENLAAFDSRGRKIPFKAI